MTLNFCRYKTSKMKYTSNYLVLAFISILFCSCQDYVQVVYVKPQSENIKTDNSYYVLRIIRFVLFMIFGRQGVE